MNSHDWEHLFSELSRTDWQIAIVVAGGGSGAVAMCFRRAGASLNFVEAVIPYSRRSMAEYLGAVPDQGAASVEVAKLLASAAYSRAAERSDQRGKDAVGISLTAALPTSPIRDSSDQIHVAIFGQSLSQTWSRVLPKGDFTRAEAEEVADEMLYRALATLVNR